jgi:hypothetical protein
MPLVKLKAISQDTWLHSGGGPSRAGVCYYMCNFIESDSGIWNKPMTFGNAVTSAQSFAAGTTMMSYAKAQNLRKAPQTEGYSAIGNTALSPNQIYRAWLQVVKDKNNPPIDNSPNHEIIIVTGTNNEVTYFEPNFGFFQASNAGMNNTQALEFFINQQYGEFNSNMEVRGFGYLKVRNITLSSPKSFKDK